MKCRNVNLLLKPHSLINKFAMYKQTDKKNK